MATFAATDPDGDDVTWHMRSEGWSTELRDALTLSSDGVLSFNTGFNRQTMYAGNFHNESSHRLAMTVYARGKSTGKWHQDELVAQCSIVVETPR